MSIVDDLRAKAENARRDVDRYREMIASNDRQNAAYRERIESAELEAVGAEVAANILQDIGLNVDRVHGTPRVSVASQEAKP